MAHNPHNHSISKNLATLTKREHTHLQLAKRMFKAPGNAIYGMDLLATGVLNRSKAHISGFKALIEAKNLICAGALLRLQLDSALRFYAAYLVERPNEFALAILNGKKVRNLKDSLGQKMTDAYLCEKLGERFDWVPRVYERTSGYVHLSDVHLLSTLSSVDTDNRKFTAKISSMDKDLPDEIYIEALDAFTATTDIILEYVHGWVLTKANPELVAEYQDRVNCHD